MITITTDIYEHTIELPITEKIQLVDKILTDIKPVEAIIEEEWILEIKKRHDEYKSGRLKAIPGEEVFAKLKNRFNYEV